MTLSETLQLIKAGFTAKDIKEMAKAEAAEPEAPSEPAAPAESAEPDYKAMYEIEKIRADKAEADLRTAQQKNINTDNGFDINTDSIDAVTEIFKR